MINNTYIRFTQKFRKEYQKSPKKIQINFNKRLEIFLENNNNPVLKNHPLIGELKGFFSININGDWRAIYSMQVMNDQIYYIFEFIGTHSQLYG